MNGLFSLQEATHLAPDELAHYIEVGLVEGMQNIFGAYAQHCRHYFSETIRQIEHERDNARNEVQEKESLLDDQETQREQAEGEVRKLKLKIQDAILTLGG